MKALAMTCIYSFFVIGAANLYAQNLALSSPTNGVQINRSALSAATLNRGAGQPVQSTVQTVPSKQKSSALKQVEAAQPGMTIEIEIKNDLRGLLSLDPQRLAEQLTLAVEQKLQERDLPAGISDAEWDAQRRQLFEQLQQAIDRAVQELEDQDDELSFQLQSLLNQYSSGREQSSSAIKDLKTSPSMILGKI